MVLVVLLLHLARRVKRRRVYQRTRRMTVIHHWSIRISSGRWPSSTTRPVPYKC
ncbi:hypothetical protein KC19_2G070200 [Ceratodon purpureus]|uniref:Uncharacterized protein n=1 Tax=Ceratodon purpureus TaxID=3225 RepID=A0A8T0ITQ6_CERPU|nr:hypothetical protein KC19_2G070200 [Ceratodon purpureus]